MAERKLFRRFDIRAEIIINSIFWVKFSYEVIPVFNWREKTTELIYYRIIENLLLNIEKLAKVQVQYVFSQHNKPMKRKFGHILINGKLDLNM